MCKTVKEKHEGLLVVSMYQLSNNFYSPSLHHSVKNLKTNLMVINLHTWVLSNST